VPGFRSAGKLGRLVAGWPARRDRPDGLRTRQGGPVMLPPRTETAGIRAAPPGCSLGLEVGGRGYLARLPGPVGCRSRGRWSTALAVVGVAAVAAVVSYEHASALVREHGESGWTGRLIPLTMDGLVYVGSMVMLDSARRGVRVPALARWLLGLGIVATLAANVAHGLCHGLIGAAVGAWPAVALVGSYELLMVIIRSEHRPADTPAAGPHHPADPVDRPVELPASPGGVFVRAAPRQERDADR
jgi:hypothetical protein